MKIFSILILLALLQLVSCQQKYGFRKTVRVPSKTKQETVAKQEIGKPYEEQEMHFPELANADSNKSVVIIPYTQTTIGKKLHISEKKQIADSKKNVLSKPESKRKHSNIQEERKWNKMAISAFILSLIALGLITLVLFGIGHFALILVGIALALMALILGVKSLKTILLTNDKGKGFAWVSKIIGVIVCSIMIGFFLAVPIAFFTFQAGWQYPFIAWGILSLLTFYFYLRYEIRVKTKPLIVEKSKEEKLPEEKPKSKISILWTLLLCLLAFVLLNINVFLVFIPIIIYIIWYRKKHPKVKS